MLDIVLEHFDTVQGIEISEHGVRFAREQLKLSVIQGDLLKHDLARRNST
jgi:hypothetical protein